MASCNKRNRSTFTMLIKAFRTCFFLIIIIWRGNWPIATNWFRILWIQQTKWRCCLVLLNFVHVTNGTRQSSFFFSVASSGKNLNRQWSDMFSCLVCSMLYTIYEHYSDRFPVVFSLYFLDTNWRRERQLCAQFNEKWWNSSKKISWLDDRSSQHFGQRERS